MGWLLLRSALVYKFDLLDAFSKFDIVNELNLISYKFHYLVCKIYFCIYLFVGRKVKFDIRFYSHKTAMNFKFKLKIGSYPATKICGSILPIEILNFADLML